MYGGTRNTISIGTISLKHSACVHVPDKNLQGENVEHDSPSFGINSSPHVADFDLCNHEER